MHSRPMQYFQFILILLFTTNSKPTSAIAVTTVPLLQRSLRCRNWHANVMDISTWTHDHLNVAIVHIPTSQASVTCLRRLSASLPKIRHRNLSGICENVVATLSSKCQHWARHLASRCQHERSLYRIVRFLSGEGGIDRFLLCIYILCMSSLKEDLSIWAW
jgi:hypothetical protein